MIRVLQELSALDGGGVAKLVYDYYLNMDRSKVHFDFVIYDYYEDGIYEQPLRDLGCTIYKLPRIKSNTSAYLKGLREIIKNGNYDVIHSHMGSRGLFVMRYGKKYGVKRRIVHSHIAYEDVRGCKKLLNRILSSVAKHYATDLFACGYDAGLYMWGKKASEAGKVRIMTNAVDTDSFRFSKELREAKQKELGVEGKLVIGIVGRLSSQKNYPFLFKAYRELLQLRDDTVLVVVGRGLEENQIKGLATEMGIEDKIKFLGIRSDVAELLNAFDVFVLPSLYEGLPVVLVEAQANGVREIVSDRVTKEMDITDLIKYLPIGDNYMDWAKSLALCGSDIEGREAYSCKVSDSGYNIKLESIKMQNFYMTK